MRIRGASWFSPVRPPLIPPNARAAFEMSRGYYMRVWDFIYGLYDTIEEALRGDADEEDPP